MEEYLLQGPPAYKRQRLGGDPLQASANFVDARANMVPFGFIASQDRDSDMSMAAMSMGGNLALNSVQDFGQLSVPDWRHTILPDNRNRFVHKLSQALIHHARSGENSDSRSPKWVDAARKIEGKAFKSAKSPSQYFSLLKKEIHKIQMGYGYPVMSSQFLSSSTTSTASSNNMLGNMQQNYGPNNFGEPVAATQSHNQPGIAHSATSVNLFSDESIGRVMRVPVTSSMGSARPQFESFNGRQPAPQPMIHDQVPDQVVAPNLLHSMYALRTTPISQFMPSSAVSSQQRFGLNDSGSLSENSSITNTQIPGRQQSKEWHKSVTFNIRNRIIRKMAQKLSTITDPQGGTLENRMLNCIAIATSIENETYRTANTVLQYYDLMAKRCYLIDKGWGNPSRASIQYYNFSDIRRTYEALGINYPPSPTPFPATGGGGGNNNTRPPPPPSGVMPSLMGSSASPSMPYCPFARRQPAIIQQANHNQLLDRFLQCGAPLNMDVGAEVPEVIKQLAHAYKCQERESQENDVMLLCSLPHCREMKNILNHITTCQAGICCCGSTKGIIEHWNRCTLNDCPICLPVRQGDRNLNSTVATSTGVNNQINMNFMRRPHRGAMNSGNGNSSNYPSTATSGLLSNQSPHNGPNGPPNGVNNGRNERISSERTASVNGGSAGNQSSATASAAASNIQQQLFSLNDPGQSVAGLINDNNRLPNIQLPHEMTNSWTNYFDELTAEEMYKIHKAILRRRELDNQIIRRPHRGVMNNGNGGSSGYPSTATSGLLSNQASPNGPSGPPNGANSGRSERISPRSSMWHSSYNSDNSWRSSSGGSDAVSMDGGGGRRAQPRFWLHNRNNGNRHERRMPFNYPWAAPEIIFVDNARNGQPQRTGGGSLFGPMGSGGRNAVDRFHPYGTPWRSPDILFVENVRPAHRHNQDTDEPVIIPSEEDATPSEHQQMMAIVKVVKTHGGRLEQKFRCSRRSCNASWPCLHRRLAASIQSLKTPIPG